MDKELHALADAWAVAVDNEAAVEVMKQDADAALARAKEATQVAREAYQRKLHEWQSDGHPNPEPWKTEPDWAAIYSLAVAEKALAAAKKGKK